METILTKMETSAQLVLTDWHCLLACLLADCQTDVDLWLTGVHFWLDGVDMRLLLTSGGYCC
jgi:hypothetical protein